MNVGFEVDEKDVNFLQREWDILSSFYTSDESIRDDLFQIIREKYSEKSRFYHNLSHVKTLLNLLASLEHKIQDQHAMRFSIWFHDVIYDTQRKDNELESARTASAMLSRLQVNADTIELVYGLIVATKYHGGVNLSQDAKFFLDMDLAILGAGEDIYDEYSNAIREEYSWVSELLYRKGRKQILKRFMSRARIYFTDEMQRRYEKQARTNIKREIKSLDGRKKTRASPPADG